MQSTWLIHIVVLFNLFKKISLYTTSEAMVAWFSLSVIHFLQHIIDLFDAEFNDVEDETKYKRCVAVIFGYQAID